MKRLELDVVVGRHSQDVVWTLGLPAHCNVFVYNQGTDLSLGHPCTDRGGHQTAFLTHIIGVYNKLSNYESDYIALLNGDKPSETVRKHIKERSYSGMDFLPLGVSRTECDKTGEPAHPNLPIEHFAKDILGISIPDYLEFTAGSQFIIHKRALQRYPIDFFFKIYVNMVANPLTPFIMERLWEQIFASDILLQK